MLSTVLLFCNVYKILFTGMSRFQRKYIVLYGRLQKNKVVIFLVVSVKLSLLIMKTILLLFYYVYTIKTLQLSDCFADKEFVFVVVSLIQNSKKLTYMFLEFSSKLSKNQIPIL